MGEFKLTSTSSGSTCRDCICGVVPVFRAAMIAIGCARTPRPSDLVSDLRAASSTAACAWDRLIVAHRRWYGYRDVGSRDFVWGEGGCGWGAAGWFRLLKPS